MTERMNMMRIGVPEQRTDRQRPFDASTEVTQADWNKMREYLGQLYKDSTWGGSPLKGDYARLASYVKTLNPDEEVNFRKQGKIYNSLDIEARQYQRDGQYLPFVEAAGRMKIIDPSFFCRTSKRDREGISELWNRHRVPIDAVDCLAYAHIFYPAGRQQWSREEWEEMRKTWGEHHGRLHLANQLAMLRVACPEFYIPPSEKDWERWRTELDGFRSGLQSDVVNPKFILNFAELASAMRILAAKEMTVDEQGLHISGQYNDGTAEQGIPAVPATPEL